jgi:signal transduction histidine kinase
MTVINFERNEGIGRADDGIGREMVLCGLTHDIRGALSSMKLLARLAGRKMTAGDAPGALALLARHDTVVSKVCELCNDVLECDRRNVDGAVDRTSFELVDMVDVVKECVDDHAGLAQEAHCTVQLRLPDRAPSFSHRRSLYRVIANLLRNAVLHGNGRMIEVRVEARAQRNLVIVRDNGVGIPSDVLARLFDRGGARHEGQDHAFEHFGLGLWVVRHLIHSLGGWVHVASEVGQGTAVAFALPALGR